MIIILQNNLFPKVVILIDFACRLPAFFPTSNLYTSFPSSVQNNQSKTALLENVTFKRLVSRVLRYHKC